MKIRWIGHASFYIETSNGLRIRTDPYDNIGLPLSDLPADVVTVSHGHYDHSSTKTVPGHPTILKGPQDTILQGAAFRSIPSFHDDTEGTQRGTNTIFVISADDLTLVHLGDLGQMLAHSQIDDIGDVDILCVPVGGVYTLDAEGATELIAEIDPRIVLPMHYKIPGLTVKLESINGFLENKPRVRDADELEVTQTSLPERQEIVVLRPRP